MGYAKKRLYLFLDTNCFLEFRSPFEIDWPELTGYRRVTLVICPTLLRELDKHKGSDRPRLRARARKAISDLREVRREEGSREALSRRGIDVLFVTLEPVVNGISEALDLSLEDDRLIASALSYASLSGADVAVATGDFGMELKVETHSQLGIVLLPDSIRLPDDEDGQSKKLKQVEAELV